MAQALFEKHPRTESPYVFSGKDGGRRIDINKPVNAIRKAAGLPKNFRPLHGLRHVYASMLASSGQVDLYTLQKMLTHKDPRMTQRYAHLRDEALQRASDVAGSLLEKVANGTLAKAEVNREQKAGLWGPPQDRRYTRSYFLDSDLIEAANYRIGLDRQTMRKLKLQSSSVRGCGVLSSHFPKKINLPEPLHRTNWNASTGIYQQFLFF
jgi:hypothetical protein